MRSGAGPGAADEKSFGRQAGRIGHGIIPLDFFARGTFP
jgi:hypothetical protein